MAETAKLSEYACGDCTICNTPMYSIKGFLIHAHNPPPDCPEHDPTPIRKRSTLPPTAAEPSIPDPWNQKHTVTAAEPSEPKADGFDAWESVELAGRNLRLREPTVSQERRAAYQAGEQSGVRKGMQRALEAVRKISHAFAREHGSYDGSTGVTEFGGRAQESIEAYDDCEAAILAEMGECK